MKRMQVMKNLPSAVLFVAALLPERVVRFYKVEGK
ncbi:hypothetical protein CCACVL1_09144 [Corchorus capsularis]|uniref:Uncharacterized protein n=1 Tax=Corchorus capsularis TaxID=210143 RepID=A0A1R3IXG6_COCAP|nr:hypothetical protein CCACVL1_09144 [Corchorus capsularis]